MEAESGGLMLRAELRARRRRRYNSPFLVNVMIHFHILIKIFSPKLSRLNLKHQIFSIFHVRYATFYQRRKCLKLEIKKMMGKKKFVSKKKKSPDQISELRNSEISNF